MKPSTIGSVAFVTMPLTPPSSPTSAKVLISLVNELQASGIAVYFADVHGPVFGRARETGLLEAVDEERIFPTVDLAIRALEQRASASGDEDRAGGRS